jgi:ribosomal protein L40E
VGTTTQTSTVTATESVTFTIPELSPNYCYYTYVNDTFKAGVRLLGKVTTNSVMDFYVMSSAQYQAFRRSHCGDTVPAYVSAQSVASSYSLDWTVPVDDMYYFVFYNYAPSGQGAGQVVGTFALQEPMIQVATFTLKSTSSGSNVLAITKTMSSVFSSTIVQPSMPSMELLLGIIVILAALAGIVVVAFQRRGKSRSQLTAEVTRKPEATIKPGKDTKFCINCGAELPSTSKFCNKCGSAQT